MVQPFHFLVWPLERGDAVVTVFHYGGRRDNLRSWLADGRDKTRVHMVAVDVGDQDQVGWGHAGNHGRFRGIDINILAARLDQQGGVVDGRDFHGSRRRFECLYGTRVLSLGRSCQSGKRGQSE